MHRLLCAAVVALFTFSSSNVSAAVTVSYSGETLPVYIVFDDGTVHESPQFETKKNENGEYVRTFELKAGKVKLWVRPKHNQSCLLPAQYAVGSGNMGPVTIAAEEFTVKDGEQIFIKILAPIPPWNAAVVSFKEKPVLVSWSRPQAYYQIERWEKGEATKDEEFANSPLFIAEYGMDVMAKRVAQNYLTKGTDRIDHLSVIPSIGLEFTEEELVKVIKAGFEKILTQAPAIHSIIDDTGKDEIMKADVILKAGRGRKPKK